MPRRKPVEPAPAQPLQLKAEIGCCEEASMHSTSTYVPCNRPAKFMVGWPHRQEGPYRMCEMCADHSVRNRGAVIAGPYKGPVHQGSNQPAADKLGLPAEGGPTMSAEQLLSEYFRLKDYLAAESKRFTEFCAPYKKQQEALENQMLDMLNRLGGDGRQSIKTESGTFFRVTIVTPKIVDREKYLDVVLENYATWGNGMLQLGAPKKEAIDAYSRENNGALPEGVETSSFVNLNVRRA